MSPRAWARSAAESKTDSPIHVTAAARQGGSTFRLAVERQRASFEMIGGKIHMNRQLMIRSLALGAVIATSFGVGFAIGAQPHMEAALGLLQNARRELQAALPNKGGHRERAMGLIDQAITETQAGIAYRGN